MRLYLSSYRLGRHVNQLKALLPTKAQVAIISNATDHYSMESRVNHRKNRYDPHWVFSQLGYTTAEVDLREYFDQADKLRAVVARYDLIWAVGGNCFLLRRAMYQSGFDLILQENLAQDNFVYGGFSAGVCVLAPSLRGIELCDEPEKVPEVYQAEVLWEGLGIIDVSVAPHYRSDHPEAPLIEEVVRYFERNQMPFIPLRDGDVLIQKGTNLALYPLETGLPNPLDRSLS